MAPRAFDALGSGHVECYRLLLHLRSLASFGVPNMCVLLQLCAQLGLNADALTGPLPAHMAASVAVLAAPGLVAWALDAAGRWVPTLAMPWQALPAPQAAVASASAAAAGGGGVPSAGSGRAPGPAVGFLEMAYGYTPLVWAATLAHYLLLFCEEAGRILPVRCQTETCSSREGVSYLQKNCSVSKWGVI